MARARALTGHSDPESHDRFWDRRIVALAVRQHGVVARLQLVRMGLSPSAIQMRVRRGKLHRIHQGVYAVGHPIVPIEGRFMAAVLAGGPGAVLSHRSAAAHYGIRQDNRGTIDITCPRALHRRRGITWHRSVLPHDEITLEEGVPITTVPRTLFDLAATLGARQAERAMHEAEVRRLWDDLSLRDLLARYPNRPGAPAIREILGKRGRRDVTQNDFEEAFREFLVRTRLPMPAFNEPLLVDGRRLRPDCIWRPQRLVAELDGRAVHGTDRNYESDRARDRALLVAGWRSTRITWRQLHDEPDKLQRELRALLLG